MQLLFSLISDWDRVVVLVTPGYSSEILSSPTMTQISKPILSRSLVSSRRTDPPYYLLDALHPTRISKTVSLLPSFCGLPYENRFPLTFYR